MSLNYMPKAIQTLSSRIILSDVSAEKTSFHCDDCKSWEPPGPEDVEAGGRTLSILNTGIYTGYHLSP